MKNVLVALAVVVLGLICVPVLAQGVPVDLGVSQTKAAEGGTGTHTSPSPQENATSNAIAQMNARIVERENSFMYKASVFVQKVVAYIRGDNSQVRYTIFAGLLAILILCVYSATLKTDGLQYRPGLTGVVLGTLTTSGTAALVSVLFFTEYNTAPLAFAVGYVVGTVVSVAGSGWIVAQVGSKYWDRKKPYHILVPLTGPLASTLVALHLVRNGLAVTNFVEYAAVCLVCVVLEVSIALVFNIRRKEQQRLRLQQEQEAEQLPKEEATPPATVEHAFDGPSNPNVKVADAPIATDTGTSPVVPVNELCGPVPPLVILSVAAPTQNVPEYTDADERARLGFLPDMVIIREVLGRDEPRTPSLKAVA